MSRWQEWGAKLLSFSSTLSKLFIQWRGYLKGSRAFTFGVKASHQIEIRYHLFFIFSPLPLDWCCCPNIWFYILLDIKCQFLLDENQIQEPLAELFIPSFLIYWNRYVGSEWEQLWMGWFWFRACYQYHYWLSALHYKASLPFSTSQHTTGN